MADNTRVNELQDKLLKAMDILNAQALNSISFDKTITCKIENDKDKKDGKYEVNDGNRIFTAYSSDTRLRAGDTVYVTVPEGNFENQKMIIGKKTADNDKPFNFTQPFDTFFDMTGNIIISNEIKEEDKELIANSIEDKDALIENCKTSTWLIGSKDANGDIVMADVSNKDLIKYTRLAVRADFRTWIKNAVRGEYGINIYLRTSKPKTISAENNTEKEYGNYKYNWNNSMMYGNTYNFETYYSQEIVLDLEKQDIGRVDGIAIEFYQKANFYDKFNEPIPSSEDGFETKTISNEYERYLDGNGYYKQQGNPLSPNIFIDNFYLSFGYDISTFTDDFVEIYTQNRNSYRRSTEVGNDYTEENQKEIKMRWVHLKNGSPVDMVAAAGNQSNGSEPNYEVRWYRYSVGAAAVDEYCGVYWIEEKHGDFNLIFNPDVNKQQEKIKAIVLCDGIPYRSNELIFENEEDLPPSKEAQHIMTALNIECNDKTNGNYLVYGQNRDIKDSGLGDEIRSLSLWFDADNNGQYTSNEEVQYTKEEQVIWYFPANNTMIKLLNEDKIEVFDSNGKLKEYQLKNTSPRYQIKKSYNTSQNNNTISCQYTLNGVVYNTEKTLTFGIAGTMGSEQTLVVDFLNDTNAIDLDNKGIQTYRIKVQLYDTNGRENTDLNNISWEWWKRTHEYLKLTVSNGDSSICNLQLQNGLAHGQLYILKVSVGDLETYFSIPLKSSNHCDYIEGPTEVIYQSNGEPDFYNYPYKIYNNSQEINSSDIGWSVISTDTSAIKPGNYDATIQNNKLNPVKMFVKDAPFYGVKGGSNIGTDNEQIFWTQPIIVMQNRWPSNVINKWDGKTIEIDNGNGTILTQALAAGTKNSNNEFSGVMIGEWKHTDSDQKSFDQTGVFGFHEGAMSYAFKEDGTAFIGKSSMARINFDGSNATIYSAGYNQENSAGMMIDLYGGGIKPYIKLKSANGKSIMELSTEDLGSEILMKGANIYNAGTREEYTRSGQISLTNKPTKKPLSITGENTEFSVDWDGNIKANSGTIGGWKILTSQLTSDDGNMIFDTNGSGTILLKSRDSLISGGTIKAGVLSSTGEEEGDRITLLGYLELENEGVLGEVSSNFPGATGTGIGMSQYISGNGKDAVYSVVKATTDNAGFSCGSFYSTATLNEIATGHSSGRQFAVSQDRIAVVYSDSERDGSEWLEIRTANSRNGVSDTDKGAKLAYPVLHCAGIPAENQFGIYARFA